MGSSPSLRPGRGGGCDIFPSPSSRPFSCDTADSYRGIIPASDRSADDSSTFSSPSLFCICVHTSLLTLIPPLFFFSPSWKSDLHLLIWGFFSQHVDSHHRRWAPKAVWWFNEASLLRVCVCVSAPCDTPPITLHMSVTLAAGSRAAAQQEIERVSFRLTQMHYEKL